MKLSTTIEIAPLVPPIALEEPIVLLGSCFSDNIGNLLQRHKFEVLANPFGTIFNPVSLCVLAEWALWGNIPMEPLFVEQEGIYKHFFFHSNFYAKSAEALERLLAETKATVGKALRNSKRIVITLGTAWVYEHIASGKIVANCHKAPSKFFHKRLLSIEEVSSALLRIQALLPQAQIILTVSPVRHLKDTIPLNMVSKSILRLAVHQLQANHPAFYYFPAYELMMDELRDYRFYTADLIHPNEIAIEYIWTRFIEACIDMKTTAFITRWSALLKSIDHRPLVPYTASHKKFLQQLLMQLHAIKEVNVQEEINRTEVLLRACD